MRPLASARCANVVFPCARQATSRPASRTRGPSSPAPSSAAASPAACERSNAYAKAATPRPPTAPLEEGGGGPPARAPPRLPPRRAGALLHEECLDERVNRAVHHLL